jgi:hypothetical protein
VYFDDSVMIHNNITVCLAQDVVSIPAIFFFFHAIEEDIVGVAVVIAGVKHLASARLSRLVIYFIVSPGRENWWPLFGSSVQKSKRSSPIPGYK